MSFELLDRYLLGEPVSKAEVVEALLASRSQRAEAAPFYRALEALGARAADEAFIALRLVVAGKEASDENVRLLRAFSSAARAGAAGDAKGLVALFARDRSVASTLPAAPKGGTPDFADITRAARAHYTAFLV